MLQWHEYVERVVGGDSQVEASRKTGIDQTTISRWLNPKTSSARRTSQAVAAFARGYDRPVLEAFVIAGFLSAYEAGYRGEGDMLLDLREVPADDLMRELRRRLA